MSSTDVGSIPSETWWPKGACHVKIWEQCDPDGQNGKCKGPEVEEFGKFEEQLQRQHGWKEVGAGKSGRS